MLALFTAALLAVLPVSAAPPIQPATGPGAAVDGGPPAWWSRLNAGAPGGFPTPRPFKASYRVSWGGMEAAHFDSQCSLDDRGSEITTLVKAHTTGLARTLWNFDATHLSVVDPQTLKPLRLEQIEDHNRQHSVDRVEFTPVSATRTSIDRSSGGEDRPAKSRRYDYPGLLDMESTFLYMRSLPLAVGETRTVALMTAGSPYLATIRVVGRGNVQVKAGEFPAFEYAVSLEKISKYGTLEARKGFKSARAWVSDDANRVIVKAEAEVFVGTVTVELESLRFTEAGATEQR